MRERRFGPSRVFQEYRQVVDRNDLTTQIEGILRQASEGTTEIQIRLQDLRYDFSLVFSPNRMLSLKDEQQDEEVLLVERIFNIPPYHNYAVRQLARTMEQAHEDIFQRGVITIEMLTHRDGNRITPVSASRLYLSAIKKVTGNSRIGGVFSVWEDGQLNTLYSQYLELYQQLKDLEEEKRKKQAAQRTKTGTLLTSIRCLPEYIHQTDDFVAVLYKQR